MGKIENLEKYINLCDKKKGSRAMETFIEEVVSVYENEISNIRNGLDTYGFWYEGKVVDYCGDIDIIKAKLINYKDNLEMAEQKRKDELELARLKQGNINVSASASNSNKIDIAITLEQVIDTISQIPDDVLTETEKDDLEDKLSGIDAAIKGGKKEKAKEKLCGVLKFLVDKGADALIAVLPYLGQMAVVLNQN